MALVPYLLNDVLNDLERPMNFGTSSIFDQNFGLGVLHDDLLHPRLMRTPLLSGYVRPWRHQASRHSGVSNIQNDKGCFKVNLDIQQFKPDEINVKVVDDFVVVEGKHEERQDDHGHVSRQFQRRYRIPQDVDPDTIISKLSSDGMLSIEASKKPVAKPINERVIQITHTNSPAVTSRPCPSTELGDSGENMDQ